MQALFLATLLLASAGVKQSSANEIKGGKFLFTYPADTFLLSNKHKAVPKIAKVRMIRRGNGAKTAEVEIDTSGEITEEPKVTTNNDIEELEVTTAPIMTIPLDTQLVEEENLIDEEEKNIDGKDEDYINKGYQSNRQDSTDDKLKHSKEKLVDVQWKLIKEESLKKGKSLLSSFPNYNGPHDRSQSHSGHRDSHKNDNIDHRNVPGIERATDILDQLSTTAPDSSGRKCVDKVMMREETEYDEILTCDHSYDKRCHDSYVTKYEPHQEEECDEKFRKVCIIDYDQKAIQEVVEVCITPFVKDCAIEGKEVCQTVYESECSTVQIVHQVEDDVANCRTEEEKKCEEVTEGFQTVQKCDVWPVERCSLEKKQVKKYTPQTSCQKVPKEMCSPGGCGLKEGPVQCQDKVKTVIVDNPIEDCDMEPLRTCKHVTKLVPKLEVARECVDVPKEICARSKVNPRRVKKPSIQKWCFTPTGGPGVSVGECLQDRDCQKDGIICDDNLCVSGCRMNDDCPTGHFCSEKKCRAFPGRVLIKSFTIKTLSCTGCSQQSEGVKLSLQGEQTAEFTTGVLCNSSVEFPLNHQDIDDFGTGGSARFDGSLPGEEDMMGGCYKAPLNAMVTGGSLTWVGEGEWTPSYICVDWQSSNYGYQCQLQKVAGREQVWQIADFKKDCKKDILSCQDGA